MPTPVKPRWGEDGVVEVRGHGLTDDQFIAHGMELAEHRPGDRGCLLSDAQFSELNEQHLHIIDPTELAEVRARLDHIREFYLKALLYKQTRSAQRECNAALAVLRDRIQAFLASARALDPLLNWSVADCGTTGSFTAFDLFTTLPERLYGLAESAAEFLPRLSDPAVQLGHCLIQLDAGSQNDLLGRFCWTAVDALDRLADVLRIIQRLGDAVDQALIAGRTHGGPRPFRELIYTIARLFELYEELGGQVTHTPRLKTHYDGMPHSAAGQFVAAFLPQFGRDLPDRRISGAMTAVIGERNRQARRGQTDG